MFIAYINQTDNGCDYTIACGKTLIELQAQDRDQAILELKTRVIGTYSPEYDSDEDSLWGPDGIQSATLYEVISSEDMPIGQWQSDANQRRLEARIDREKVKRREQYEQLRKEFEKNEIDV
jgi:hypothetical protein